MKKDFKCYAFYQGAYLGFGLIALTTVFYIYNSLQLLPTWNMYSVLYIVMLFAYSIYCSAVFYRKTTNKIYVFRQYFTISFLILAVALMCSKIYMYILYNTMDSTLLLEYAEYTYNKHNVDMTHYSFDQWLTVIKGNFKALNQLQEYVFSLIPCTLYSAIISLLMKFNHNS